MGMLVVVLVLTNLLTVAWLAVLRQRAQSPTRAADPSSEVFHAPRPAGATGRTRRLISIEILNPVELVSNLGRVVGLAGSIAPELTRRVVYDRTLKILRRQLRDQHVVADLRLHILRPLPPTPAAAATQGSVVASPAADSPFQLVEDIQPISLSPEPWDQPPV